MKKLFLLLMIIALPLMGVAQENEGYCGKGRGKGIGKGCGFFKDLDLSAEQKEQLRAFKDKRKGMRESFDALRERRETFHKLFSAENLDEGKIRAEAKELQTLQAQAFEQRVDKMLELRKILGPEKFAKVAEKFKEHFKEHHKGRWHKQD